MHPERNATQTLANFALKVTFDDLPKEVVHQTKRVIYDTIGCALGAYLTERGQIITTFARNLGGNPESTIIGSGEKTSCTNAVLANSNMANALDFDEVFGNMWHPAVCAVPAALAIGEREKANGRDLITAVATGYDIATRVGMSPEQIWLSTEDGRFVLPPLGHSWKVFAPACAAGRILKLSEKQMINAIGLAAMVTPSTTFGKWTIRPDSLPMGKYIDNGWIGLGGLTAAMLAKLGYTGPERLLDGENGFWGLPDSVKRDLDFMVSSLGQKWWIMETSFKPWPCVTSARHSLTALKKILERNNLKGEEIDKVVIRSSRVSPLAAIKDPKTPATMQFNVRYNVANLVFNVVSGPHWQDFTHVEDPKIKEFRKGIIFETDPKADKVAAEQLAGELPRVFWTNPTTVEVTARGKVLTETVDYAKGDPWNPETKMTDEELKEKFRVNAADVLPRERIEKVIETMYNLEAVGDVAELTELLSPQPSS